MVVDHIHRHHHRFLLVIFSTQSHLNPALHFAKRLIAMGAHVTLVITVEIHRRLQKQPTIPGLSLVSFSDGYDDGFSIFTSTHDQFKLHMSEKNRRGSEFLAGLIASGAKEGNPFTSVVYTLLNPWAHEVAREFHLPVALLWIEPATVFDIAYYYFHGYEEHLTATKPEKQPYCSIEIPGLPILLSPSDVPTFLTASRTMAAMGFMFPLIERQFQLFDDDHHGGGGEAEANPPIVLINTFEALEPEALRAVDGLKMLPVGPLIPSAFLDGKDLSDTSSGAEIFKASSDDYVGWLDSKPEASVVYVSFGSYFELSKRQTEEIGRALLDSGHPFLWVMRSQLEEVDAAGGLLEQLESKGKIVQWCSQVEVLSHPSLGCFLTHCGWNSTMESLASGVPLAAFPQWADQNTNAKLIEDVWKTGVRMDHKVHPQEKILHAQDIRTTLDVLMGGGEKGQQLRRNANKWKQLAKEAMKEGGSSHTNLRCFLDLMS